MRRNWRGFCGKMARRRAASTPKLMMGQQTEASAQLHRMWSATTVVAKRWMHAMTKTRRLETRLRTPVTLGSRFGDWHVTWVGGWSRYRLYYLVMVVRLQPLRTRPRCVTAAR